VSGSNSRRGSEQPDRRVSFDFEIDFSNGGGIQGQGFRLDLHAPDISDRELADYIVQDLRLLMVKEVRILNKRIILERHKRSYASATAHIASAGKQYIDLSHTLAEWMVSHANAGTYINSPLLRLDDRYDLAELPLDAVAEMDAVVIRVTGSQSRIVDWHAFAATDIRDKAVLVHTDWAQHWGTAQYFDGHPFLTATAATYLKDRGARLVGIDSSNIDDTADSTRPVRTILLGAAVPIVEHLRGLDQLPISNFTFSAVPPKVKGMGSFPVRAYATLPAHPAPTQTVPT
jgi:arylformamidase